MGDGRQPYQHECYERIGRTHHEILGRKEMVRLAVNWEVRLRGNEQREGAFLKVMLDVRAVERLALGLPINIVISRRWDYACECGNFHEMRPPLGGKFLFALTRIVDPVCGVDRVSSSVVTSLKLRTPQVELTASSSLLGG